MNRESSCVAYFESKFSPKRCSGLKAIGMTAAEVRRAMRKYCKNYQVIEKAQTATIQSKPQQPTFLTLPPDVKDEILEKIIKRQGTLRSIAETYGVSLASIQRIANEVMHLRKQTPRILKTQKKETNGRRKRRNNRNLSTAGNENVSANG